MLRALGLILLSLTAGQAWSTNCDLPQGDLDSRPLPEEGPTEITTRLYVNDLISIHDADQSFVADAVFRAEWNDPRLAHNGTTPCVVSPAQIWHPVLQLINRRTVEQIRPPEFTVTPAGLVTMFLRSYGEFSFRADLSDFPFDEQELRFKVVSTYEAEDVRLVTAPDLFGMTNDPSVANWSIAVDGSRNLTYYIQPVDKHLERLDFVLHAVRLTGYYTWQQLVPLFLVVMMTWVVFWIPYEYVPPRVGLAATAMLTLIAYRFAMSSVLPPIAYLTRLDIFMIGASILVFAALSATVAVSYIYDHHNEELADKVNNTARWLSPLLLVLVALGAFYS